MLINYNEFVKFIQLLEKVCVLYNIKMRYSLDSPKGMIVFLMSKPGESGSVEYHIFEDNMFAEAFPVKKEDTYDFKKTYDILIDDLSDFVFKVRTDLDIEFELTLRNLSKITKKKG